MNALVTIVIVNYNSGGWLLRCLNSVLSLEHVASVVVIDNNSSDDSIEQVKPLVKVHQERLELILNANNVGFAAANNQVLQRFMADGGDSEYVLLLNPDCEMNPNVLPAMLTAYKETPQMGMAGCIIRNEDGSMQTTCRRRFPTPVTALLRMMQLHRLHHPALPNFDLGDEPMPESLSFVEAISGAFMLVRVSAMQEVGLLDETYFMHCEDLDWCKRFELAKWQIGFVPSAHVIHAKGVSSRSRPVRVLWTLHRGMLRFFDKFYRYRYPFYVRWSVTVGIYMSFLVRTSLALVRGLFPARGQ